MTISKPDAFAIFKGLHLGQSEAAQAIANFTEEQKKAYYEHVEDFQKQVTEVGEQAFLEISMITAEHHLNLKPQDYRDWTVQDYMEALEAIHGSTYEQIHLMNLTGRNANKALLARIQP